jgi:hypothetical protein
MSHTTKRAKSAHPVKLAPSPLAEALERARQLPGADLQLAGLDVKYARAADAVALPVLAAFGVLAPGCDTVDFYAVLDEIATAAGPRNSEESGAYTPRVDAAFHLGIAIGMRLAGGAR